ncbi:MAG TPA: alkaline phosphatase family protein [Thermoanaerobaculia bacterium]|nr:alkaline phosphatase family protein [Thermoanaerobaculia bacterium]
MPGALLGAHLAGLIFFLNPQIPFTALRVGRATVLYGLLLGAFGLALQLPWTWRRTDRALRLLPWTLTIALGLGALLDAAHASIYAFYLPAGINVRLLKTAIWLALGALIAFYTALLHTLHQRRYGWRSRWALALLSILSLVAVAERREAFRAPAELRARQPAVEPSRGSRLWVIGLDGATLDAILPLAGQGRLPAFAALLREGAYGRLESLNPTRRAAVWITLATGKYPFKHGVTGELPHGGGLLGERWTLLPRGIGFRVWGLLGARPTREAPARHALALWEILDRLGLASAVVAWPSAWPPVGSGTVISERFFRAQGASGEVRPSDLTALVEGARVREEDLDPATLATLGAKPSPGAAAALAGDLWREAIALSLGEAGEEDRGSPAIVRRLVVLSGLAEASRADFGGFHAAQFLGDSTPSAQEAARRVAGYYEHLDRFVGTVLARDRNALVAVVSAHGVAPVGWWERAQGAKAQGGSFGGGPDGVLMLHGPGVRAGALLTGARLVDVAPTLLYALGLPVARDFDGRVLTPAFEASFLARRPLSFFPSYEALGPLPPTAAGAQSPLRGAPPLTP